MERRHGCPVQGHPLLARVCTVVACIPVPVFHSFLLGHAPAPARAQLLGPNATCWYGSLNAYRVRGPTATHILYEDTAAVPVKWRVTIEIIGMPTRYLSIGQHVLFYKKQFYALLCYCSDNFLATASERLTLM